MEEVKKKILVVDDERTNLVRAKMLLQEEFAPILVSSGEQCLEYLKDHKPDLILLDIMLPKISGFDVCKLLKTDNATWRIPIVIMSTLTDEESRERATEAGADYFIPKPYNLPETLAEIKKYLKI